MQNTAQVMRPGTAGSNLKNQPGTTTSSKGFQQQQPQYQAQMSNSKGFVQPSAMNSNYMRVGGPPGGGIQQQQSSQLKKAMGGGIPTNK